MLNIIDFIYDYAEDKIIRRGEAIYEESIPEVVKRQEGKISFAVSSSSYDTKYRVKIEYDQNEITHTECNCPYDWGDMCKHEVASLLTLNDMLESEEKLKEEDNAVIVQEDKKYDQRKIKLKFRNFTPETILSLIDEADREEALALSKTDNCTFDTIGETETIEAVLKYKGSQYTIKFEYKDNWIYTYCSCRAKTATPICVHKAIVLLHLYNQRGENIFSTTNEHLERKEKLLAEYGYTLDDEGLFTFNKANGELQIKPKDESIVTFKGNALANIFSDTKKIGFNEKRPFENNQRTANLEQQKIGYLFKFRNDFELVPLEIIPFKGVLKDKDKFKAPLDTIYSLGFNDLTILEEGDSRALEQIQKISYTQLSRVVARRLSHYNAYWNINRNRIQKEDLAVLDDFFIQEFSPVISLLKNKRVFTSKDDTLKVSRLVPLQLIDSPLKPTFNLTESDDMLVLQGAVRVNDREIENAEIKQLYAFGALMKNNEFIPIENYQDYQVIAVTLAKPTQRVKKIFKEELLQQLMLPLMQQYLVEMNADFSVIELEEEEPKAKLYLSEKDNYLVITPLFEYQDKQVALNQQEEILFEQDGSLYRIPRDFDFEEQHLELLSATHDNFFLQGDSFYLDSSFVLDGDWFIRTFDHLQKQGFEVLGVKQLKQFKYSPYLPETKMNVSSGIDWFDCQISVSFGEQLVSLKQIRKAVLDKKNYITLGDGTLGVLPQEWLEKYGKLFKLGNAKKDSLELSKLHFSVVDELYEGIDNQKVLEEIREKKEKLKAFKQIENVVTPKSVKAQLRNYQKEGINWLGFLDEFKWGGCLADDMGLGKTLQTLTFIQSLVEKTENFTCLVVVPTSLLFNWVNEIEKFTPNLTHRVHHGPERNKEDVKFTNYNIVLTTYGTIVRDVEILSQVEFNYAILDESQAIKNVNSKRYKAVSLVKAQNKLVLTGTPVENNTFELYAQMNFLNPGFLGSQEFFRNEYANPIDKQGDPQKVDELQKIIYPFILRRTKQQVAKDLPDKSENTMICEMGKQQRKVYESFKNYYRDKVLGIIDDQGLESSGMYVLEGLLRLRQICDSATLINSKEEYTSESVKLTELINQINILKKDHKILVFSQFVGMLSLIQKELEYHKIPFSYLDGKTKNRQAVVKEFQENEEKRVFLISLKAGGVGLNLTAADYVFIVDPWWNPAVERQAIDRSHRIGQTKKVFAYKMVCKDSIEEKILKLQEKKSTLAEGIITADKSLLKSLTRNDIADLFS